MSEESAPWAAEARCRALLGDPTLIRGGRIDPVWLDGILAFIDSSGIPQLKLIDCADGRIRFARPVIDLVGSEASATLAQSRAGELLLTSGGQVFVVSPEDGATRLLSEEEQTPCVPAVCRASWPRTLPPEMEVPSPDGASFATLIGDDLWLRYSDGTERRRLTTGGSADHRWSTSGATWSADGRWLAAMRIDDRAVDRVPRINWTGDTSTVDWQPYGRASGAIPIWRIHLLDMASGEIHEVGGGDDDHFAFIHGFSSDGRELRYARMERCSRSVELLSFDLVSRSSRLLLREEARTFLYWPPTFILTGAPVRFLADGRFLWLTEASGWRGIRLHDANGEWVRALADADWPVTDIAAVDERSGRVFFRGQSDPERPYDVQIFRVGLDGGQPLQLSQADGIHELRLAPDGRHFVDMHSSVERAPCAELRDADGQWVATLSTADTSGLAALGWAPPERLCLKAADGITDLFGLLYKPYGFDPERSYPVIEQIYAGPQTISVPHGFGPTVPEAFAQLGYVTIVIDARGTPGRGKAFQDVAVGQMGEYEIADHVGAIRQAAATRPWMDVDRVGIFGISYGGYFTIRAMLQAPDLYRAGVALAPAELGPGIMGVPIECFEGRPTDNPDRYARLRNTDKMESLEGALMLIGATDDVNTPVEQTFAYTEALVRLRKPFDQLVLPGCNHLFMGADGQSRIDFVYTALLRHFERILRPEV